MATRGPAPKTVDRAAKPALTFPEQNRPEWFQFAIDGESFELPSIHTNLSFGAKIAGRMAKTGQEQLLLFLQYEASDKLMAAAEKLRGDQPDELMSQWLAFEGATLPE